MSLVELKQVSKRFDDHKVGAGDCVLQRFGLAHPPAIVRAVDGVDLAIQSDEVVGLVDGSGCGKSTLGRIAAGLMPPLAGEVCVDGRAIDMLTADEARAARLRIQMIFQDPYAGLSPRLRVEEIVDEAARVHGLTDHANFADYAVTQMQRIGLDPALCDRYPHQFNGGQRQRIGIARALAMQPSMLVYDEVAVALDMSVRAQILSLFIDLHKQLSLTYLLISHDPGMMEHLFDRVVIMYFDRVMEPAPAEEVFHRPNHPYTRTLLAGIPCLSARRKTFTAIQDEMPSPPHPPTGCRFHPCCPRAIPRCKTETPMLRGIAVNRINVCHLSDAT